MISLQGKQELDDELIDLCFLLEHAHGIQHESLAQWRVIVSIVRLLDSHKIVEDGVQVEEQIIFLKTSSILDRILFYLESELV